MPSILKMFIIVCIILFLIYVIKNVKNNNLNIQNSLIWIVMSIGVIICTIFENLLKEIPAAIGVETFSNLIFFIGFIFLIYTCFNITKTISKQNKKIICLTQELALLRKKIDEENNKK